MPDQLTVFATITPKPQFLDAARDAIIGIIPATRSEPGCHQFTLHDGDGNGRLYLYEVWADDAALSAHHGQPYTQVVFDSYREWLAEPVELIRLQKVD